MKRTHTASIETNEHGEARMLNKQLMDQFFKDNPSSTFEVKVKKLTKGHSSNTMRYYWAEVVTKLEIGFRGLGYDMDQKATETYIKQFSPIMYDEIEINGQMTRLYRSISDLSQEEFGEHIETMKRFAAQELSIVINDPTE